MYTDKEGTDSLEKSVCGGMAASGHSREVWTGRKVFKIIFFPTRSPLTCWDEASPSLFKEPFASRLGSLCRLLVLTTVELSSEVSIRLALIDFGSE